MILITSWEYEWMNEWMNEHTKLFVKGILQSADSWQEKNMKVKTRHPFWLRWGSYTCPQCWHQWPTDGVETTSWSPSSNMATHRREWPQTSEPGAVVGLAQSLWPWSAAWNRGISDARYKFDFHHHQSVESATVLVWPHIQLQND